MEDCQFRQLLDSFGYSWTGYRRVRKGVKKRLRRHMQGTGSHTVRDYIQAVRGDGEVRLQFERLMTVSISRFFRDRGLWADLQRRVLPRILQRGAPVVRLWSAGCASGEEVYSFRIIWESLENEGIDLPDLEILGTDINPAYLKRADAAVHPPSSMREVPEGIRSSFFETLSTGEYALVSRMKRAVQWQVRHLLSDPPEGPFDMIFLRNNLLTYYKDEIKIPAMKKVVGQLDRRGSLVIGSHETIPAEIQHLRPLGGIRAVFQNKTPWRRDGFWAVRDPQYH